MIVLKKFLLILCKTKSGPVPNKKNNFVEKKLEHFFLILLESSETHFNLVAIKIGTKLNFSSNYGHSWCYCGQFSKNFEKKIDHFSKK